MNIEKTGKTCIEKKYKGFEKPVDKIKRWKRNIRFIFQRVKYGYCDSDVWSIDYWFLMVMPGMLKQLKVYPKIFFQYSKKKKKQLY